MSTADGSLGGAKRGRVQGQHHWKGKEGGGRGGGGEVFGASSVVWAGAVPWKWKLVGGEWAGDWDGKAAGRLASGAAVNRHHQHWLR